MRNLKKILAMVLALVMAMSLMTVANAADFSDDADISYKEAVDVMTAIGVINGMDDGSFNPEIFSATRIKVAPAVCFIGFVSIVYAIIRKPKDNGTDNINTPKE